jgi:7,8-dihydropterin-6-yl-methyl-4-(beta-D-ribofuranosyl)aminobenzene 5'-phosphate synthase
MGTGIQEQALVLHTSLGLILITGCAHPGILKMTERAQSIFDEPIYLVMGGFHLRSKSPVQIKSILSEFRQLGVERVAPSHCTGEGAIALFEKEYGEDFIRIGAGKILTLEGGLRKKKSP